jgi:RHS repeat-associated protein
MLINSEQAIVAKYLYDAFGNVLSASGLLANANLYRFSSKEAHLNSGLLYYLYRYYDPNLQRWPNRDPLEEIGFEVEKYRGSRPLRNVSILRTMGGINLYEFVDNQGTDFIDILGLDKDAGCVARCNQDYTDSVFWASVTYGVFLGGSTICALIPGGAGIGVGGVVISSGGYAVALSKANSDRSKCLSRCPDNPSPTPTCPPPTPSPTPSPTPPCPSSNSGSGAGSSW